MPEQAVLVNYPARPSDDGVKKFFKQLALACGIEIPAGSVCSLVTSVEGYSVSLRIECPIPKSYFEPTEEPEKKPPF